MNAETDSGLPSPKRDYVYQDHEHLTETEPNRRQSTPLFHKGPAYLDKIRPSTGVI